MGLRTAAVDRSGFSQNAKKLDATAKQLKECAGLIGRGEQAKKRAVKIVSEYLASVPRGDKTDALKSLCTKANIHVATFYRWQEEVKEDVEIGDEVRRLAEKGNRAMNTPFRKAILEARREKPNATVDEVFRKACTYTDGSKKATVKTEPIQSFVEALNAYLRKTDNDAEGLLQAIRDAAIPKDKLCAALRMFSGTCQ